MMSGPLAAYPYCPNLVSLYISAFLAGFGSGNVDTAGNVIILNIWEGRDSGPYMHALHFTFGLGAFLAPLIARPFLDNTEVVPVPIPEQNITESHRLTPTTTTESVWTIKTLYPLVSSYGVLASLWCLYYFLRDRKSNTQPQTSRKPHPAKLKIKPTSPSPPPS